MVPLGLSLETDEGKTVSSFGGEKAARPVSYVATHQR